MGSWYNRLPMLSETGSLSKVRNPAFRVPKHLRMATTATFKVPIVENENNVCYSYEQHGSCKLLTTHSDITPKVPLTEPASKLLFGSEVRLSMFPEY